MSLPYSEIETEMTREKMGKISDGANIAGITLFGIAVADLQIILSFVATILGIVATGFTIWFHVSRLLEERRK